MVLLSLVLLRPLLQELGVCAGELGLELAHLASGGLHLAVQLR